MHEDPDRFQRGDHKSTPFIIAVWNHGGILDLQQIGNYKKLWARGIWFSENDVLHVLLIFWVTYIATVAANRISLDYSVS